MSMGKKRVRIDFNMGGRHDVALVKEHAANMIDTLEDLKKGNGEQARCAAIAQTKFEEAAMWAVKAFTSEPDE